MKFNLTESMGPVLMGWSKHGDLVRGTVRGDGRIFWAYCKGAEQWLTPLKYRDYQEVQARAAKKFGRERNVMSVKRWRKERPDHARALSRRQNDERVSANAVKRVHGGFSILMEVLEEGHEYITAGKKHLRLPITKTDARALRDYLRYVTGP